MNEVDGDAARAEVARQPLGEADQRCLRHGVERDVGLDHPVRQARADRNDPPALAEMRRRGLRREHNRADIDRHDRVDIRKAPVFDRPSPIDAGVVDEDVEAAKRLRRLIDRALHGRRIGAVGCDRGSLPAKCLDGLDDAGRLLGGALVGDGDIGPFGGKLLGDCGADSATGAGDEGALSGKTGHGDLHLCINRYINS